MNNLKFIREGETLLGVMNYRNKSLRPASMLYYNISSKACILNHYCREQPLYDTMLNIIRLFNFKVERSSMTYIRDVIMENFQTDSIEYIIVKIKHGQYNWDCTANY